MRYTTCVHACMSPTDAPSDELIVLDGVVCIERGLKHILCSQVSTNETKDSDTKEKRGLDQ